MPLQALSSVNRCIKILLQMVNWFLAGKDIGQPRTRFLWDDVSQFTSENLEIYNIEVQKGNCQRFYLLHPDLHLHQGKTPPYFPGKCQRGRVWCIHRLNHLDHWEQTLQLSACLRIWRSASKNNPHRAPGKLCDLDEVHNLGKCKEWGHKWAPSCWKLPQRYEITIGLGTVFIHILRKYKHNSASSNVN